MTTSIRFLFAAALATSLTLTVHAQEPPGAQVLGPSWIGQQIDVRGFVIAWDGDCRQVAVERDGIEGAGGRVWACYGPGMRAPELSEEAHVRGVVSDTRMTRMGPRWRVVPVVQLHAKR
ncbi:hypothetical protein ASG87_01375 [Frateuria sp. Soil773]|uniref:hypothetical protein n=1 Tax=Frateuria sp. Soil773 TaxID=1736407 RepID=UPI0006F8757D|nr:hypothetical protein [Frateuria sp. Soil773]KRE90814.1 hypothetical protein ASG87_01375 [Frateuria sp. Soil773]